MTAYSQLNDIIGVPASENDIINVGDYVYSPSGVYYGTVQSNGQFTIFRGSDPVTSAGGTSVWAAPATPPEPYQVSPTSVAFVGGGTFQVSSGPFVFYLSGSPGSVNNGAYAALSDTGTFTLFNSSSGGDLVLHQGNDTVKSLSLSSVTYNLSAATFDEPAQIGGPSTAQNCINNQPTDSSCSLSLSQSYTKSQTWNWNLSEAVTVGVTAGLSGGIAIPGLASGGVSVTTSASSTTTISGGQSSTTTQVLTYTSSLSDTIPPNSEYEGYISAQQVDFSVPYSFTGVATYQSGATAAVAGSGTFNGTDAYDFQVVTQCLRYKGGSCPEDLSILPPSVTVPEPSGLLLLPLALCFVTVNRMLPVVLLATAGLRGVHRARRRRSKPGAVPSYAALAP